MYVDKYVCLCVYKDKAYKHMYVCMNVCLYVCMYVCYIYIYTFLVTYVYNTLYIIYKLSGKKSSVSRASGFSQRAQRGSQSRAIAERRERILPGHFCCGFRPSEPQGGAFRLLGFGFRV